MSRVGLSPRLALALVCAFDARRWLGSTARLCRGGVRFVLISAVLALISMVSACGDDPHWPVSEVIGAKEPGSTPPASRPIETETQTQTEPAPATYRIGGAVSGLVGTLVLQNDNTDELTLVADGTFIFPTSVADRFAFLVSVNSQPAGQTCSISNGSGSVSGGAVANVIVVCSANFYPVGGTVTGLSGTLVLQNNGSDDLTISANGSFSFAAPVASGSAYAVTVLTQPENQICNLTHASGSMANANIGDVVVACGDIVPKYAYVTNRGSNSVWQYTIDVDGRLAPMTSPWVFAETDPYSVTVDPSGRYVYVANYLSDAVSQYTIGANGNLVAMTPSFVLTGDGPNSIAVDPSGRYAYVVNNLSHNVSQYTIGADGSLSAMAQSSVLAERGPYSGTVDPSGRYTYVTSQVYGTVLQYRIGADGSLTPMTPSSVRVRNAPASVAVDPSGRYVYVANQSTDNISQAMISAGGELTLMTPPLVAAGDEPNSVIVDPSGRYVYVVNALANNVSQYTIGADGRLAPMSPSLVSTGMNPASIVIVGGTR